MTIINCLLDLFSDGVLDISVGSRVNLALLDLAITVVQKSAHLTRLPGFGIGAKSVKHKALLIIGQLTVLAEGIKANNVFALSDLGHGLGDLFPFFLFVLERFIRGFSGIFLRLDLSFISLTLTHLLFTSGVVSNRLLDQSLERSVRQAGVVNERHRHVATEAGHLLVVHAWLAHNLFLVDEALERVKDVGRLDGGGSATLFFLYGLFSLGLLLEDVVGDAGVGTEHAVDHERVVGGGVSVLQNLRCFIIDVSLIIGIVLNGTSGSDKLGDVNSGGSGVLREVISELLQVVAQVD